MKATKAKKSAVEAPEKSGTSLFIAEAAEQGKEIFAVPGNADSPNSVGTASRTFV